MIREILTFLEAGLTVWLAGAVAGAPPTKWAATVLTLGAVVAGIRRVQSLYLPSPSRALLYDPTKDRLE